MSTKAFSAQIHESCDISERWELVCREIHKHVYVGLRACYARVGLAWSVANSAKMRYFVHTQSAFDKTGAMCPGFATTCQRYRHISLFACPTRKDMNTYITKNRVIS